MTRLAFFFVFVLAALPAAADELFPTTAGMTWEYQSDEEFGGPAAAPPVESTTTIRLGRETHEGREFLKFETLVDDAVTKIELATVDDKGFVCHFRAGKDARLAKLDPPHIFIPADLKPGVSWESDGEVAGMEIHQRFNVVGEELTRVPAGSFRAFHIHCDDASVMSVALDRWFVPGVGFVKETTVVRGPTGGLLQRSILQLKKKPEVVEQPSPTPSPSAAPQVAPTEPAETPSADINPAFHPPKRLVVEVSPEPSGASKTEFKSDVENIYVRWRGANLPANAKVRVAWIAEDVGDLVEPNFIIDETESVAPAPDASAKFTLGRPPDGWAEGKYRVEFYVNDDLEETVRVTIVK